MVGLTLQPWELHQEPRGLPLQVMLPRRELEELPRCRGDASMRDCWGFKDDYGDSPRDHILAQLSRGGPGAIDELVPRARAAAGSAAQCRPPPPPPATLAPVVPPAAMCASPPKVAPGSGATATTSGGGSGSGNGGSGGHRRGGRRGGKRQAKGDVPADSPPPVPMQQQQHKQMQHKQQHQQQQQHRAPKAASALPPTLLTSPAPLDVGFDAADSSSGGVSSDHEADGLGAGGALAGALEQELWPEGHTTVMLRNIPNRYTAEELLAEMIAGGFEGSFDFFYLPIDFKTKRNRGYSFINFFSSDVAARFVKTFDRERLTRYTTQKILEVSPAVTQGFQANVARYVRKDAQRIKNAWFRPMIFGAGGEEEQASEDEADGDTPDAEA